MNQHISCWRGLKRKRRKRNNMADKFNNRYRIPSARLHSWDYSNSGLYFVTICTKGHEHYFGKIIDGKMQLSEIGEIIESEWLKTFEMRPDMNLEMDEYVVMPNHFHAIIIIGENRYNTHCDDAMPHNGAMPCRDAMHCVSTPTRTDAMHCVSTIPTTQPKTNKFGPQSKNLSSVIRGFKIGVTKNARKIDPHFEWQPRFYDHIIRNSKSLENIQHYIFNNPLKWKDDEYNN